MINILFQPFFSDDKLDKNDFDIKIYILNVFCLTIFICLD